MGAGRTGCTAGPVVGGASESGDRARERCAVSAPGAAVLPPPAALRRSPSFCTRLLSRLRHGIRLAARGGGGKGVDRVGLVGRARVRVERGGLVGDARSRNVRRRLGRGG